MWARAFRDKDYHAAINTNNGTESLNKVLKYNYLPRKKNITLSSMCAILIESFLPDAHQKYVCLNCMQSSQYRSYKSHVPDYLRDRPRSTVVHCLERKSKALKYGKEDIEDKQGIFSVKGSNDKTHRVRFGIESDDGMPSCTCTDWQHGTSLVNTSLQYSTCKVDGHGIDFTQNISRARTSVLILSHLHATLTIAPPMKRALCNRVRTIQQIFPQQLIKAPIRKNLNFPNARYPNM